MMGVAGTDEGMDCRYFSVGFLTLVRLALVLEAVCFSLEALVRSEPASWRRFVVPKVLLP